MENPFKMRKTGTAWLLAAMMVLGAAFVVLSPCAGRGAEVCAIASLAEPRCEQQRIGPGQCQAPEDASAPISFHYDSPHTSCPHWPASYQRPPTHSTLI